MMVLMPAPVNLNGTPWARHAAMTWVVAPEPLCFVLMNTATSLGGTDRVFATCRSCAGLVTSQRTQRCHWGAHLASGNPADWSQK